MIAMFRNDRLQQLTKKVKAGRYFFIQGAELTLFFFDSHSAASWCRRNDIEPAIKGWVEWT